MAALERYWRHSPPPAIQLTRIGMVLGLENKAAKPSKKASSIGDEDFRAMAAAGLGITEGRPDDPMLAFLDN